MSEEERLKLENELLMTKSKAQMINLYLDKLEEIERLNNIINEAREYIEEKVGNEIRDMMYVIDVSELLEILERANNDK